MSKKENSLVAIILVNFNASLDTIECIKSIKKNNYRNISIIVVDNDSVYTEKEILYSIEDEVEVIYSDTNLGFAGGNNLGIQKAISLNADYVLLLNNDTVIEKDSISKLLDVAESDKSVGIVGGKILFYDDKNSIWYNGGSINKNRGNVTHHDNCKVDFKDGNAIKKCTFITGCFQLIRTEVIKKVGFLSEEYFLYFEDVDYCQRVLNSGWKLIVNSDSRIYHKVSKSTVENSDNYLYYFSRNRLMFIKNNISFPNKIVAYFYTYFSLIYKFIKYRNTSILVGIKDYFKHRKGKR